MTILAIDPGPTESAFVVTNGASLFEFGKVDNDRLLNARLTTYIPERQSPPLSHAVCERIRCMGMTVGAEVLETAEWCGTFRERWIDSAGAGSWHWITRNEEKLHLCNTPRAKDANIRQALIDRFGGKDLAIGTKKAPGALYGVSGDCWAALAVAVTWYDKHRAIIQGAGLLAERIAGVTE